MNTAPAPAPATTPRRRWLPSLGVFLWLALFLGLSLSPWRVALISRDGDPSLHWRIGSWMIEQGTIIREDVFSYTRTGAGLISKEWLAEVLFAAAGNLLGWNGAVLLAAALIATTLGCLYRQLVTERVDLLLALGLVFLAAVVCQLHWLARPHLITHLLIVIFGWQLRGFERDRISAARLVAVLVPLMGLWANLHGAFPYGLVLIGLYFIGFCWNRQFAKARTLLLVGVAGLVVTLCNPNGWRLHAIILTYLRDPTFISGVNEFLAPDFHSDRTRGFVLQLFVLGLLLLIARPRLRATDLVLLAGWGYAALHSIRNIPIFGLVATPILAEHWQAYLNDPARRQTVLLLAYRRLTGNARNLDRTAGGMMLAGVVVIGLVVASAVPLRSTGTPWLVTNIATNQFPVAAVRFLHAHPDAVGNRMFNTDSWGGYLMLEMPQRKVFMDSRHEFYGAAFIHDYKRAISVSPEWMTPFERYRVDWTLLPAGQPLNRILDLHPDWEPVFRDPTTIVFQRRPSD